MEKKQKALIYCRVSSERQKNEGHGLDSQEQRCRDFAISKDYVVEKVFRDSYSGGGDFLKRPAMSELLNHLDKKAHEEYLIIFDDLKRFARDTVFHWKLRTELNSRGAKIACLNFNFEDTPEGEFIETILAAQGQLERQQNKRQVIQKMKARLESGYWSFFPPTGYINKKDSLHGKLLIPQEPESSIIKEALEGFASGRFQEQLDVKEFLERSNFMNGKPIHLEFVKRILSKVIYAGYIEYQDWGVERRKGHHEAIISLDTYERNHEKLFGKKKIRTRADTTTDFPLRGLMVCAECEKLLTASWSKGRNSRVPYYRCNQKCCKFGNKSVNRDSFMHPMFELLLKQLEPKKSVIDLVKEIVMDVWNKSKRDVVNNESGIVKKINAISSDIDILLDRITKANTENTIKVYEEKVNFLTLQKEELERGLRKNSHQGKDFGTAFSLVMENIKNPLKLWQKEEIEQKRLAFKLVFNGPAVFYFGNGFGTANLAPIYKLFWEIEHSDSQSVEMAGIEPASEMFSYMFLRRVVDLLLNEEHLKILTLRQTERQNSEL